MAKKEERQCLAQNAKKLENKKARRKFLRNSKNPLFMPQSTSQACVGGGRFDRSQLGEGEAWRMIGIHHLYLFRG